jgi:signal transduction histidine kinase
VHNGGAHTFLAGGGEMGRLMREKDWRRTPLGAPSGWPQSLRSAVSILLPSRAQIALFWGPELITLYNDAYRPVFGGKHPHALGLPIREAWSELWGAGLRELFDNVLRTGEAFWAKERPFYMERHGFAEETFFDVSYDPVRDESGAVGGVFCIVSEQTGRVIGERRLRLLRELGRVATDARGVEEVFRMSADALEAHRHDVAFALLLDAGGRALAACGAVPREGWPPAEAVLEGAALERFGPLPGGPWPEPARRAAVLPLAVPGQPPAGFLVAGASPRIAFDDAYRDFLRLVAGGIGAALAAARALEEQRARAQALAELDRAKTAFFSNVSHEFRTPLTLMLGPLADSLADAQEPLPPGQRERQRMVLHSALRLQKLVNTLLDFSRIEAGRAQASYASTDLAGFTANIAASFRSAMEKAGLRFVVDCPPLGEPAYVDREMWEKIVLNLVSNAFKFTFEGEIRVTLRMEGDFVLEVRDTGTGIAADELPRVFERFRRIEGARSRTHEGTGIGLALVQELVKLHGGEVSVHSVEGSGSAFSVRIPRGQAHLPAERIGARAEGESTAASYAQEALGWLAEPEAPEALAGHGARILLADDNADMRGYLKGLLAPRYEVEAVADGEAALAAARRRRPDLVLSDVMMPALDGFGLVRALRADPALRGIPVILLSARVGEEARIEGLDSGADDYLQKPFSARELLARISARLELASMQRELERLFTQTPVPTAVFRGEQLVFEMANPAYVEVAGGRDLVGKPLLEAMPELREQGLAELLHGVMRSGAAHTGAELPVRVARGGGIEDTYWNFIYAPLRGPGGEVDRVIAICNEVTEQVRAREAERRREELIAVVSQELRNPLAALAAAVQLLRLSQGPVEPDMLQRMERELGNMVRITDDLLAMSRILRGDATGQTDGRPAARVSA